MTTKTLNTKDRAFWVAEGAQNDSSIRTIIYIKLFEPAFSKLSDEVEDDLFNQEIDNYFQSGSGLDEWLPEINGPITEDTWEMAYADDIEDDFLFMKNLTRTPDAVDLKEVYEKAIGERWEPQLKQIMLALSMEKISVAGGNDFLKQNDVSGLPSFHGWKVIEWRADSKNIDLGALLGNRTLICDTVIWRATFDNIVVDVTSEMGWRPYLDPSEQGD